jgi:8-oxo-dGTP diphosphatase
VTAERVDVAYALVSDAATGAVLLVRNRDSWSLPGGRREESETLAQAAVRETKEETGIVVEVDAVVHVSERLDADVHDVFTVFRARVLFGELGVRHDDEDVSEVAWIPVDEASHRMPWYQQGLAALLATNGAGYSVTHE